MTGRRRRISYLGLACTMHDPAIAIVNSEGSVVFAEAAERPLQTKRAFNCPPDGMNSIAGLLKEYCEGDEVVIARTWTLGPLGEKPPVCRLLNALANGPTGPLEAWKEKTLRGFGIPASGVAEEGAAYILSLFECLEQANPLAIAQSGLNAAFRVAEATGGLDGRVSFREYDHHLTHAACAALTSPFDDAVVAVMDASGERTANAFFRYDEGQLERVPSEGGNGLGSLGFFYWHLCRACGFDPLRGEEWKVMGLAPYGQVDGELHALMMSMFRVDRLALQLAPDFSTKLTALMARRRSEGSSPEAAADVARTGQEVFADISKRLLTDLADLHLSDNLVLSGGGALNSAWNGRILSETPFRKLHVFSAPADDGNALGAALLAYQQDNPGRTLPPGPLTPYLGSRIDPRTVESALRLGGLTNCRDESQPLARQVARLLADGAIVGWVQGRAEYGPRALGNRSLLADPRRRDMKDKVNRRVKFREGFRPFAPSVLDEYGAEWFTDYAASPYMERALKLRPGQMERVPAVVHVDGTARLQSVQKQWNPEFYDLLVAFHDLTGVPMVLNTSFNVMGKPIVHSVEDALAVFFTSGVDVLVLGDVVLARRNFKAAPGGCSGGESTCSAFHEPPRVPSGRIRASLETVCLLGGVRGGRRRGRCHSLSWLSGRV